MKKVTEAQYTADLTSPRCVGMLSASYKNCNRSCGRQGWPVHCKGIM